MVGLRRENLFGFSRKEAWAIFQCINIEFLTVTRPTKHTFFHVPEKNKNSNEFHELLDKKKETEDKKKKKFGFCGNFLEMCLIKLNWFLIY